MSQSEFPSEWYEERVRQVLSYCKQQTSEDAVAEDEAAFEDQPETVMEVPKELVRAIREPIARHQAEE